MLSGERTPVIYATYDLLVFVFPRFFCGKRMRRAIYGRISFAYFVKKKISLFVLILLMC
jgi:hypothetical protein